MLWLKNVMIELGKECIVYLKARNQSEMDPVFFCDNQGTLAASKNPAQFSKLKHLELKYHFLKSVVQEKKIKMEYCKTSDMIADIMTKALGHKIFNKMRELMQLVERAPNEGRN